MAAQCPHCGAEWQDDRTCESDFHQLLFWEAESPDLGVVHHLMVLNYHLQHPHLYSPDGLQFSINLLRSFVDDGVSTEAIRRRNRDMVDSGKRAWKVTGRPDAEGSYAKAIEWTMYVGDVVDGGMEHYVENVEKWAKAVLAGLKASGNMGD